MGGRGAAPGDPPESASPSCRTSSPSWPIKASPQTRVPEHGGAPVATGFSRAPCCPLSGLSAGSLLLTPAAWAGRHPGRAVPPTAHLLWTSKSWHRGEPPQCHGDRCDREGGRAGRRGREYLSASSRAWACPPPSWCASCSGPSSSWPRCGPPAASLWGEGAVSAVPGWGQLLTEQHLGGAAGGPVPACRAG